MIYRNILIITQPHARHFSEWLKDEMHDMLFEVLPNAFYTLNKLCHGNYDMYVLGGKQYMCSIYTGKGKETVDVRIIKPT